MANAKAGGMAPGYVVQLNIYTYQAANAPISRYTASVLAAIRRQFSNAAN